MSTVAAKGYQHPELLIDCAELHRLLTGNPGPSPIDRRPVAGDRGPLTTDPLVLDLRPAEEFASGHIPGAVHLELFGFSLVDTNPAPLHAFMWMIEHVLASRGVSQDRTIVVYDQQTGMRAARAFWFLEYFGHERVRVLDGGFSHWKDAGLPIETMARKPAESEWTGSRRSDRLATWRDVHERLGRAETLILDVRSDGEYYGTTVRAARGGAIPGAVHIEWTKNLDETGRFKPAADLRELYAHAGVTPERDIVTYCQGGYRAAHAYLALRLLGYPRVRTYVGSWKEWGDRLDLPIETPRNE